MEMKGIALYMLYNAIRGICTPARVMHCVVMVVVSTYADALSLS